MLIGLELSVRKVFSEEKKKINSHLRITILIPDDSESILQINFPPQNLFSYIFNAVDSPLSILIPIEQKDKPLTQEVFAHVFFFSNTMRNKVEC